MNDLAVVIRNLSKQYRIGGPQERYRTFRSSITNMFASPLRRARGLLRGQAYGAADLNEEIWALSDLSLEIKRGEVVGIIGHNGAGKSTLLKILSRITEPTAGCVEIYGRVGALLEVGTGFHPELTGRENVFLNAAILGMTRREIDRKFDEIVDFAEIEKFIDTPVKYYSSGMALRLGFAVAAHLDPDILIVDEVLAVGDAAFQKKCLGKMQDVAQEGRTVLFVSHNLDAVTLLTERSILLEHGQVTDDGPSQSVVMAYLRSLNKAEETGGRISLHEQFATEPYDDVELIWMETSNEQGEVTSIFSEREPISVTVGLAIHKPIRSLQLGCTVDKLGHRPSLFTVPTPLLTEGLYAGEYRLQFMIDPNYLKSGDYVFFLKHFVNGVRRKQVEALQLKIVAAEHSVGSLHLEKWVAGTFRFDYEFGPLEALRNILSISEESQI